jgi:eukaryotic-like serine/threonine-protein kinase
MVELLDRIQAALGSAYRMERELGGGGMSRVFLAEEAALTRKVVIKVLPPEFSAGLNIDRFRREIQLAASLQHPHIVPLLAAGQADGLLYYTMPLVEGESLRARLLRQRELPIGEAIRFLRDVVDALTCAHEHGVVHRDIKPDNVLVSRNHGMVTDFGVAKALSESTGGSSLTSVGVALGTPAYMAPEQASADPQADHRVDIYAVGALAYEMLTGRPPFTGSSPQAVLVAQATQAPAPVTEARATVPPGLASLVMRCLEKKPADRWQSADELLHQLEAMATPSGGTQPVLTPLSRPAVNEAIVASGTDAVPQPSARRPRSWTMLLGGAALLLMLGGAYVLKTRRAPTAAATEAAGAKMLAILPFKNLGAADDQYFADGLTEEITSRLAAVNGLGVISRTSADQYRTTSKTLKEIGRELGAGYVLEGSVRWEKSGKASRVRVTPQLIRVSDDRHLWADRYDAELADVFQVQGDIAEQVTSQLNVALGASERGALARQPTENAEAYQYYLKGNEFSGRGYSEEDFTKALRMYEEAVRLDPGFALALARVSRAHESLYWFGYDRSPGRLTKSKAAVDSALRLAPDLSEAHQALGWYLYHGRLDYTGALEQFGIARATEPNNSDLLGGIGAVQRRQGKWSQAIASLDRSAELDPRGAPAQMEAGITRLLVRDFNEAERRFDHTILLAPDLPEAYALKAKVLLARDNLPGAKQILLKGAERTGVGSLVRARTFDELYLIGGDNSLRADLDRVSRDAFGSDTLGFLSFRAGLFRSRGQPGQERVYLDSLAADLEDVVRARPEDYAPHQMLGITYARLGRKAEAIREGTRAVELLPRSKDAFFGTGTLATLAEVYATVNEPGMALVRLDSLLSVPSWLSAGQLRADPAWRPLRAEPRFQKLLQRAVGAPR